MADLSEMLKTETKQAHTSAEQQVYIRKLMSGELSRVDVAKYLSQHYYIYLALEREFDVLLNNANLSRTLDRKLLRLKSLEDDLFSFYGKNWQQKIIPLESTNQYVARINHVIKNYPNLYLAHHYTRYLGDLSGGQVIKSMLQRNYGLEESQLNFYTFCEIIKIKTYRDEYRQKLNEIKLSIEEKQELVNESKLAFEHNEKIFIELLKQVA